MNLQQQSNNRTTALEQVSTVATEGGVGASSFAKVSSVVITQNVISSRGGFLIIAMQHHGETV